MAALPPPSDKDRFITQLAIALLLFAVVLIITQAAGGPQ